MGTIRSMVSTRIGSPSVAYPTRRSTASSSQPCTPTHSSSSASSPRWAAASLSSSSRTTSAFSVCEQLRDSELARLAFTLCVLWSSSERSRSSVACVPAWVFHESIGAALADCHCVSVLRTPCAAARPLVPISLLSTLQSYAFQLQLFSKAVRKVNARSSTRGRAPWLAFAPLVGAIPYCYLFSLSSCHWRRAARSHHPDTLVSNTGARCGAWAGWRRPPCCRGRLGLRRRLRRRLRVPQRSRQPRCGARRGL